MPGSIPVSQQLNINTLSDDIDNVLYNAISNLGYNPDDPADRKNISQNELTAALNDVYKNIFKPDQTLCNNQKSKIDYNNIDLLQLIVDKFIYICMSFNKSMGLLQFSLFTGIGTTTLNDWRSEQGEKTNPKRSYIIKQLCETHKGLQIGLLNASPVGALAVANNDKETGLEWAKNNAPQITNNTVYLLPSERADRLKLEQGV